MENTENRGKILLWPLGPKQSTAFTAPILRKISNAQWHYLETFWNKFQQNWYG